jgi:hypothetical protein
MVSCTCTVKQSRATSATTKLSFSPTWRVLKGLPRETVNRQFSPVFESEAKIQTNDFRCRGFRHTN